MGRLKKILKVPVLIIVCSFLWLVYESAKFIVLRDMTLTEVIHQLEISNFIRATVIAVIVVAISFAIDKIKDKKKL